MISGLGFSHFQTGLLVALPYVIAMIAMVLIGLSSDRRRERVFHVAGSALLGALGLFATSLFTGALPLILSFCVASIGIYAALAVFWTLPTAILRGTAAAAGLALLNSFSNLGGYFGPTLMGWAKQQTGTYSFGLQVLAGFLLLAAVSVVLIGSSFFPKRQGS
jgi:cyanate permease